MKTLPINVNLAGMPVLIIGGGPLAAEKLDKLLRYDANVTVVSPELCDDVRRLVDARRIRFIEDVYRPTYLPGYRLVMAATGNRKVHEQIHSDTRGRCCLLNAVDTPDLCDFILPAVVQGEHFSLAISTGGKAAGLARHLREELEQTLHREDDILELLEAIRTLFKRKYTSFDERRRRLMAILDELDAIERAESA